MTTTLKNTFGIEYEMNGISVKKAANAVRYAGNLHNIPTMRDVLDDGYNHDITVEYKATTDATCDAEIVTPILTPDRLNETEIVTSALRNAGGHVRGTNTGTHIHLGVKEWGMNRDARYNFVMNYWGIHSITGSLVAPARLNNPRMCAIISRNQAEDQANQAAENRGWDRTRYTSLNTQSMNKYRTNDSDGTFEVRLHQGSLNPKKINAWLSYNAALVLVAKEGLNIADIVPMWTNKTVDTDNAKIWLNYLAAEGYLEGYNRDYLLSRILTLNP